MNENIKVLVCPCCGSHKLEYLSEEIACDSCGAVFKIEIVTQPQPELIKE
jgi:transcription initiation factor TFIIIB Brf1 subunit/transcription initiation factor TFIIB